MTRLAKRLGLPRGIENWALTRSDPRSLEIDSPRGIERELKGLVLLLTHWVEASAEFVLLSKPHGCWRWFDHTATHTDFKKEMWGILCLQVFFSALETWIALPPSAPAKSYRGHRKG